MIGFPNLCCALVGLDAFVMPPSDHSDRMSLIVTLMLTVVAFKMSVSERLPAIPYAMFLDSWLLSLFSIFVLAAVESSVVFVLATTDTTLARRIDAFALISSLTFIVISSIVATHWVTGIFIAFALGVAAFVEVSLTDATSAFISNLARMGGEAGFTAAT
eukprot:m.477735 g.477735  ORF g.477735 m.477735 type:complete len:160 (-) comp44747_c0_seq1:23-502(-)